MKVGILGCGNISGSYLALARHFDAFHFVAGADLRPEATAARATEFGLRALSVEAMLADPEIDTILNLTPPDAHFETGRAVLEAGKHLYVEKPLSLTRADARTLINLAQAKGLRLGSAPDTCFGAAITEGRKVLAQGRLGAPLAGMSAMMTRGVEGWHPNPGFFYQPGGGPVLDMGPYYVAMMVQLLGPVDSVTAEGTIGVKERRISAPDAADVGALIPIDTWTTLQGVLTFRSGPQVAFSYSWDVCQHRLPFLELYCEAGTLRMPDPNFFGGTLEIAEGQGPWQAIPCDDAPYGQPNMELRGVPRANYRGLGLQDMAQAITEARPHRASAQLGYHILDVLLSIQESAETGARQRVASAADLAAPLNRD